LWFCFLYQPQFVVSWHLHKQVLPPTQFPHFICFCLNLFLLYRWIPHYEGFRNGRSHSYGMRIISYSINDGLIYSFIINFWKYIIYSIFITQFNNKIFYLKNIYLWKINFFCLAKIFKHIKNHNFKFQIKI
jgi:hypothetical protein